MHIPHIFLLSWLLLFFLPGFGQSETLLDAEEAFLQAEYAEADRLFNRASSQYLAIKDSIGYVKGQLGIASCQIALGNAKAAKSCSERILALDDLGIPDALYAQTHTVLGESYLNLGRNDLALENLLTAEGKFGEVSTDPASECFENLGLIYWNNGNLNLAQQYHEKALRIRQDLYGKESLKVGDSYNNLGLLYLGENSFKAKIYFTLITMLK